MKKSCTVTFGILVFLLMVASANAEPYIYVTNHGLDDDENPISSITVIDAEDDTVVGVINDVCDRPLAVAFSPDGKKAYVPDRQGTSITIIDTNTRTIVGKIDDISPGGATDQYGAPITEDSRGIAITPDGKMAYVTYYWNRVIRIIDLDNNEVIGTIEGFNDGSNDYYPFDIEFTPDGKKAYVTCNNGAFVIDATSNTIIKYMPKVTYYYCLGVAISPDGKKAYLQDYYQNAVIIDTTSDTVIGNLPGSWLWADGIAISPDGNKAYITNFWPNSITVIDLTSNTLLKTINGISYPGGIAFQPLPKPVASFDFQMSNLYPSVPLQFISTSTDASDCTFTWDFGDGAVITGTEADMKTITHAYDTPGTYTVTLTLSNGDNVFTPVTNTITVNPTPVVKFTANPTTAYVTLTEVQFNDGSSNVPAGATYLWDFGDGSTDIAIGSTSHIYNMPGMYHVTLTINDKDSIPFNLISEDIIINVIYPTPTINSITVPLDPVPVNTGITASASVTYLGDLNDLTAEWNWGGGSTSDSQVSSNFETSNVYNSPGVYTVTFTVEDNNGGIDTKQASDYVVVYDPQAGFVTGGGWINSPAGAYLPDNTLAGKATFGFVSKYQKGATVPTGNTEFQFKVADLNFKSTSYDWLVISGPQAKYKGTGNINGGGNYGFMLSAVDGTIKGDSIDKFRIKIWNKETDETVYDNEIGAAEDSEPAIAIGGGSIIIHTGK